MKRPIALLVLAPVFVASAAFGASASRSFSPTSYGPGQPVTVTLTIDTMGAAAQAIEDNAPAGWTVSNASHNGTVTGTRVAWFFLDGNDRSLTYQATPPTGESGNKTFDGEAAFDGQAQTLGGSSTISEMTQPPPGGCTTATKLCLVGDRFEITVTWSRPPGNPDTKSASVSDLRKEDSGLFYFLNEDNLELLIKMVNGCGFGTPRWWVFFAGTTDVIYDVTVTDTKTQTVKRYSNPRVGVQLPVTDVNAFATCP